MNQFKDIRKKVNFFVKWLYMIMLIKENIKINL